MLSVETAREISPDLIPQDQVKTPSPKRTKVRRVSHEHAEAQHHQHEMKEDEMLENEEVVQFLAPAEGTPAALALQANADIKVSRLEKGMRRIKGIKHPKAKNITKFMKRKKNKKRAFSRNFKGKVIDGVHELYTITAGMMLGLRCAVGRSNTKSVEDLLLGDFSYVEKINFPPNGNNQPPFRTPSHQLAHTFKFKTYAPLVFSKLRDFFGVDSLGYMLSVCGDYNYLEFISNSKSGQFFFYSHDGRYMIKTQTNEENKFMKRILPHYYRYVTENPHTFLVRIYGMHRVKMYHLHRKTHFVIMQSVFDTPEPIQRIYDLKGSLVGRKASEKERESGGVRKDNDLIDDGVKLELGTKREAIINQLEKDANFLAEMNIMDYSVLLGIHDRKTRCPSDAEPHPPSRSLVPSSSSKSVQSKSRSVLPFRLKETTPDVSGSTVGENNSNLGVPFPKSVPRSPGKRRASTADPRGKKEGGGVCSPTAGKRGSCPGRTIGLDIDAIDLGPLDVDNVVDEYSDYSEEEEDDEYDDDDDEFDEHFDAGDSDMSVGSNGSRSSHHSVGDAAAEGKQNELSRSSQDHDQVGVQCVKESVLTGINLTAVGKKNSLEGKGGRPPCPGDVSSIHSSSMYATVGSHTDPSGYNSGGEEDEDAGVGLAGEEGKAISKLFKDNVDLSAVASAGSRLSMGVKGGASPMNSNLEPPVFAKAATFGPGATHHHPWTGRFDGGINSRLSNGSRGSFIYYIGVIDILQQYNASKRFETVFKGLTNDKEQISSVDSVSYAKRFVKFMKDNTL